MSERLSPSIVHVIEDALAIGLDDDQAQVIERKSFVRVNRGDCKIDGFRYPAHVIALDWQMHKYLIGWVAGWEAHKLNIEMEAKNDSN